MFGQNSYLKYTNKKTFELYGIEKWLTYSFVSPQVKIINMHMKVFVYVRIYII